MSPRHFVALVAFLALACTPALANRGGGRPENGGYYYIDNLNETPGQGNPLEGLSDPLNDAPVLNNILTFPPNNLISDLPQLPNNWQQIEPLINNWFSDPPYNLGIPFAYYGSNIAEARLTEDGYIIMGNGGAPIVWNTVPMPHATAPTNQLAFHWTHMNPEGIANGLLAQGNGNNSPHAPGQMPYWGMMFGNPPLVHVNAAPLQPPFQGVPIYPIPPVGPPPTEDYTRQADVEVVLYQNNDIYYFIINWCTNGPSEPTIFGIENGDGSLGIQYNRVSNAPITPNQGGIDIHGTSNGLDTNTPSGGGRLLFFPAPPPNAQQVFLQENNGQIDAPGQGFFVMRAVRFTRLDVIPPGKVTDLAVIGTGCHQITLRWTAPANDDLDAASGPASAYDIRMSTQGPITEANFNQATPIPVGAPGPGQPNQPQQFTVGQLADETQYWFALRARDQRLDSNGQPTHWSYVSNSTNGNFTQDCDPPRQVIDLSVTGSTTTTVSLRWTEPAETNGARVTTYDLRYSTTGAINDANFAAATTVAPQPAPNGTPGQPQNYTVVGLTPDQQYWFAIKSADEVPHWSITSNSPTTNTVDDTDPPPVSTLAVIGATGTSLTLQWTAVVDYPAAPPHGIATSYEIRYSKSVINAGNFAAATLVAGAPAPAAAGTVQQVTASGLNDETQYFFAMIVHDADALPAPRQSALSNVANGTTLDTLPPFPVTDLWTLSTTATSVTLQWTTPSEQNGAQVTTYDLRYSTNGAITSANFGAATRPAAQPVPAAPGTLVSFTVSGLAANNTYWFAIKSADEVPNISPVSNSVFGRTNDTTAPGQITNLAVVNTTGSTATLTWTAPGDDGYGGYPVHYYEVRQSAAGPITAANYGAATLLNPMPPFPPLPLPVNPGLQQVYVAQGLAPLTSYWFAVKAFDTVPNAGLVSNSPLGVTQAPSFTGVGGGTSGGGISNNPNNSVFPVISFDQAGNPFVAWADDDAVALNGNSIGRQIFTRLFTGGSWREMPVGSATGTGLTGGTPRAADHPSVARSTAGNPYLAYQQLNASNLDDIYVRTWNGAAWTFVGGVVNPTTVESSLPSLAIGVGETPAVAWQTTLGGRHQILFRQWNGAAWLGLAGSDTGSGLSGTLGDAIQPGLAMDAAGNPIVAWSDNSSGQYEIYVKKFSGGAWNQLAGSATGTGISGTTGANYHPSITTDSAGNPVVCWDTQVGGVSEIYVKRFNGAAWVEMGPHSASGLGISNDVGPADQPRLCRDGAGRLFVVWEDVSSGQWQVYTKRYDGVVAWKQFSGSSASYGGVSNDAGISAWPSCAFLDATNTYYMTWSDNTPGNYEVFVASIPLTDTTDAPSEIVLGAGTGGNGEYQVVGNGTANFPLLNLRTAMWAGYNAADGAVHPSLGDVNNDGLDEVVLGTGPYTPAGGWIEVIRDGFGRFDVLAWLHVPWSAYNALNGAVYVAAANIDGGPEKDIVFGLGQGGGGWCGAFDDLNHGFAFLGWFQTGAATYDGANGEVRVAAGDVNGTGTDKIVCGFGPGGGGRVEIRNDRLHGWTVMGVATIPYPAYNTNDGGCWPAAGDLDGDGRAEAIVGLDQGGQGLWFAFDDANAAFTLKTSQQLPWGGYDFAQGELRPAAGDFSGKQRAQIVLGTGAFPSAGGWVEVVDDAVAGYAHLAWRHFGDAAYNSRNGELFPASGNCR